LKEADMKAPIELSSINLIPIYLGAGNAVGEDASPAYRIRKQIKKIEWFITDPRSNGCALSPKAPSTHFLQVKAEDPGRLFKWATAFMMQEPTPAKMDMLENLATELNQQEAFEKVLADFEDNDEEADGEGDKDEGQV